MISKFLLGGIQYTAKGFKHIKKHKKKMYKLRQVKKESSRFYGLGKKKTGYGSFVDKTKWL
jgi:hypothetical protein